MPETFQIGDRVVVTSTHFPGESFAVGMSGVVRPGLAVPAGNYYVKLDDGRAVYARVRAEKEEPELLVDLKAAQAAHLAHEILGNDADLDDLLTLADYFQGVPPRRTVTSPVAEPRLPEADLKPVYEKLDEILIQIRTAARPDLEVGQVITSEQADGLPVGATFRDNDGDVWKKTETGFALNGSSRDEEICKPRGYQPLTLVSLPEPPKAPLSLDQESVYSDRRIEVRSGGPNLVRMTLSEPRNDREVFAFFTPDQAREIAATLNALADSLSES